MLGAGHEVRHEREECSAGLEGDERLEAMGMHWVGEKRRTWVQALGRDEQVLDGTERCGACMGGGRLRA